MSESTAKVIFVGDTRVGKTSIINKFSRKNDPAVPTIGANSICFSVPLETEIVTLSIWDTAGQEEFKCLVPMYARGANVAVVVFDLSNEDSFKGIDSWIKSVREDYEIPNIIVVGNKNDLETFSDPDEIVVNYKGEELLYMHCSAETGAGIDELFTQIAMETQKANEVFKPTVALTQKNDSVEKKGCC